MHIDLTGHHVEITDSLREYVHEKMAKVDRHTDDVTTAHVILSVEKLRHKAEATLQVKGETLHADAVEEDMYAAIDALIDKLDRQARKHKEKMQEHHRASGGIKRSEL